MKLIKLAILTAASVSLFAACSDGSHTVKEDSKQKQGLQPVAEKSVEENLQETLKSYKDILVQSQLLADSGEIEIQCSEEQIKNALSNGVLLNRMLENNATAQNLSFALRQIISRADSQDCQLAALNRVALEASKKFGGSLNNTSIHSPDFAKVESSMNQLSIISSVMSPKIDEIKSSIINQNLREYFRAGAVYYYKMRESLNTEILKMQTAIQESDKSIRSCTLSQSACAEEFASLSEMTTLNKDVLKQVSAQASRLQSLSVNDPQLSQKLETVRNLVVVTVVSRTLLENALNPIMESSEQPESTTTPVVTPKYGPQ